MAATTMTAELLWCGNGEVFADFFGGKLQHLPVAGNDRTFPGEAVDVNGVASAFAQEFASVAFKVTD
jgi:hypothetical protein